MKVTMRAYSRPTLPLLTLVVTLGILAQPPSAVHAQGIIPKLGHSLQAGVRSTLRPLPDTIRVLAVRVEFQADNSSTTSGTGKFGTIYSYDYGQEVIDPYPHDRAYFVNHMRFLENYVAKVSGGRTTLVGTVLDSIVTVSRQIKDYSPRRGEIDTPVANLAVEAWTLVDQRFPEIDLRAYDMFIVFHAGKGRDVDMTSIQGYDPTPQDIPSLSFTLDGFRKFYGQEYQGIPVRGGSFHLTNCSVIPTNDSREIDQIDGSKTLLELTINGLLAASFGTWAGLPDLFDTKTGRTGIGRFGLMDGESIFAYGGIAPPAPSAWEKQMLTWAQARDAAPGRQEYLLNAGRTDQALTSGVLRVPITGREYWLVENRHRDPAGNGQRVTMVSGGREIQMRFPKDTLGFENSSVAALKGVVIDVEDLDWALPGGTVIGDAGQQIAVNGGALIWHVDEDVIDAGLASNTVNANADRRGVDLEQAGGPQDIGKPVTTVFGTSIGAGSPLDFWFKGNISPVYANRFGAYTQPSTATNGGAFSHVGMDNFSSSGPIISFTVTLGDQQFAPMTGFPVDLREMIHSERSRGTVQTIDATDDGPAEIFAAVTPFGAGRVDSGYVFAVRQNGRPLQPVTGSALIAAVPDIVEWLAPPICRDLDGDGVLELAITARRSTGTELLIFRASNFMDDGRFDLIATIPGVVTMAPLADGPVLWYAVSGTDGDILMRWGGPASIRIPGGATGSVRLALAGADRLLVATPAWQGFCTPSTGVFTQATSWSAPVRRMQPGGGAVNCVSADFDGDGTADGAALEGGRILLSLSSQHGLPVGSSIPVTIPLAAFRQTLAAADVDGDGRDDLLIADSTTMQVLNLALASVDAWPLGIGAQYALAARLGGDRHDAVLVVERGILQQRGAGAVSKPGFPVALPENAAVALFGATAGQTHAAAVAAVGEARIFAGITTHDMALSSLPWPSLFGGDGNTNRVTVPPGGTTERSFFPPERCYSWPNPAYEGVAKIRFHVAENAEVTVKIYDIAGATVDELHTHAIGGVDNEIDWPLAAIQNGVYLAHVKATAPGASGEKIIKIAVVK